MAPDRSTADTARLRECANALHDAVSLYLEAVDAGDSKGRLNEKRATVRLRLRQFRAVPQ